MRPFNFLALICEDIRIEKDDVLTLVGLIPDNIVTILQSKDSPADSKAARFLTKLSIFTRVNFEANFDLGEVRIHIAMPGAEPHLVAQIELATVEQAKSQARERGNSLAGVISRIGINGFQPPESGVLTVLLEIRGEMHTAAALNFNHAATISPTEPSPPSPQ